MATIYVDTDVSGGLGDGSSWANAYSSLSAAVGGLPDPLTEDYTIECRASSGTADTTGVSISVNTTADYTLTIKPTATDEHDGTWTASIYRLETADAVAITTGGGFGVVCNYTVQRLQIRRTTASANYATVIVIGTQRDGSVVVDSCIIRGPANASYRARTIELGGDNRFSGKTIIARNLLYDLSGASSVANSVFWGKGASDFIGDTWLYRNTIIGGEYLAYQMSNASVEFVWKGNLITSEELGATDFDTGSDYNAFEGAFSVTGSNNRYSQTFTFADPSGDDYSLDANDAGALGHGVDLSTDTDYAITHDIIDQSIQTSPSIGAFEYVSSGTSIAPSDASHAQLLDTVTLTQAHNLQTSDATHSQSLDAIALTQAHALRGLGDLTHAHTIDVPTLTQDYVLAVAELLHSHTLDAITLTYEGALTVADLVHAQSLDSVTLGQKHNLIVADALHAHTLDATVIDAAVTLVVAELAHAHALDAVTLGQAHTITIEDLGHTVSIDNVAVSTVATLSVAELLHAHSIERVQMSPITGIVSVTFTSSSAGVTFTGIGA